jgi:hypothetical protein
MTQSLRGYSLLASSLLAAYILGGGRPAAALSFTAIDLNPSGFTNTQAFGASAGRPAGGHRPRLRDGRRIPRPPVNGQRHQRGGPHPERVRYVGSRRRRRRPAGGLRLRPRDGQP